MHTEQNQASQLWTFQASKLMPSDSIDQSQHTFFPISRSLPYGFQWDSPRPGRVLSPCLGTMPPYLGRLPSMAVLANPDLSGPYLSVGYRDLSSTWLQRLKMRSWSTDQSICRCHHASASQISVSLGRRGLRKGN